MNNLQFFIQGYANKKEKTNYLDKKNLQSERIKKTPLRQNTKTNNSFDCSPPPVFSQVTFIYKTGEA